MQVHKNIPTFFHLDGVNQITIEAIPQINSQYVVTVRCQKWASTLNQMVQDGITSTQQCRKSYSKEY